MTFVKVCGVRTLDALDAARDADAVGVVVESPKSPRHVALDDARALLRHAPLQGVAVTAARDAATLLRIVARAEPAALQAPHDADFAALRREHPALRLLAALRPEQVGDAPPDADLLVLDASRADGYGGTGVKLDDEAAHDAARRAAKPVLLAGGLSPANVAASIRRVAPFGVDASSGLETNGAKDPEKIRAFVRAAKEASP